MRVLIVTAMYPTPANPAFGSFVRTQVESLKQVGVEIELLVLEGRYRKLIYPKGVVQLRRCLARDSIDLVHAHYSLSGMVSRTQWKVPVIVTYHGDDLLGSRNVKGEITRLSKLVVAAGQILGQLANAVIVQSREMASKLRRDDVYIIPHEVDLELFRPEDKEHARSILGLNPIKKYLLFAANPAIPVKRFPLAKAVAQSLVQQDPSIELLVAYTETQERLALYMNASDALIFPSFQEGSPNIVKQAMACNLPIVATDVGDVREIIGNTEGCYICEPDVTDFAERLGEVLSCPGRTQGRENVRHLDCCSVARRVVQVYEETLDKVRNV
jgi:glycosyltransferase involved in cell wall biosynthesis